MPEAIKVLKTAAAAGKREVLLTEFDWGADRYLRDGISLPPNAVEMLRGEFDAILLGAVGDSRIPRNQHAGDVLLELRRELDLYANVRPCLLFDSRLTPLKNRTEKELQFTVIRENTEGLYAATGGSFKKGTADEVAVQEHIHTRKGVERILRYAFEFTRSRNLKRLCMSDKSNAENFGHDLWQRVFAAVRQEYPEIEATHQYAENLLVQMVRDPGQFQVIVTCNLFGNIASDLGAQLSGGLGLAPSANVNPGSVSLFEPAHGSAPAIAGKGIANPMGAVLAAAMMLESFGWTAESRAIETAVRAALHEQQMTRDTGGQLSTRELGDWLASATLIRSKSC